MRQLVAKGLEVGDQRLPVGGPAAGVADRVQLQTHALQAELPEPGHRHLDHLRVEGRRVVADRLQVELVELPVAAGLRLVMAEHGADQVEPGGLGTLVEVALEVGPHRSRGAFGTQDEPALVTVVELVELLADNVGLAPHSPLDQLGRLQDGSLDLLVAEPLGDPRGRLLGHPPGR